MVHGVPLSVSCGNRFEEGVSLFDYQYVAEDSPKLTNLYRTPSVSS